MQTDTAVVALVVGWSAYFALHSALASLRVKHWVARRWPGAMRGYRLAFNLLAVVLVLPLVGITLLFPAPWLWRWEGVASWIADGLALAALAGFVWTTRYYSMAEFLGTRQWRMHERRAEDQEGFYLSPLHRWVRHPWYFLGLIIVWSRDMTVFTFTTAVMVTLYLFIGAYLEERKLIAYHGERYREYRRRVPGILPLPWKHLSKEEAGRLTRGVASD